MKVREQVGSTLTKVYSRYLITILFLELLPFFCLYYFLFFVGEGPRDKYLSLASANKTWLVSHVPPSDLERLILAVFTIQLREPPVYYFNALYNITMTLEMLYFNGFTISMYCLQKAITSRNAKVDQPHR